MRSNVPAPPPNPSRGCPLLLAFLLLAGAAVAAAQPAGRAPHADVAVDAATLLGLAERGDPKASLLLGTRYASGRGGVRDDSEAVRWFRRSAELGLAEGQYNLGIMYANGRGVVKDLGEAARWFGLAAEQGIAEAQFNLGALYGKGAGVARDEKRAAHWFERAARAGLAAAQFNLGVLYEHGRGVPLDADGARKWYRRAADQSFPPARDRLAALERKLEIPPPAEAPEPAAPPAAPAPGGRAPGGIFERDPGSFTVQLASLPSDRLAREFVARHRLEAESAIVETRKGEKRFYAVVYGDYPSYRAAREAAAALDPALRKGKPWVRNVGVLRRSAEH